MLTEVRAGPYTLRGISVAGVYTCLQVPELKVMLDVGLPLRSFAGTDRIFLSHVHGDHASGLVGLLGIRELVGKRDAQLYVPEESARDVEDLLALGARVHHSGLDARVIPMAPGARAELGRGLEVRAFRTLHSVPSLGYAFVRRVTRVRDEFRSLPSEEIARRRLAGDQSLFEQTERVELAYATDTRADVLDVEPWLFDARVLALECTYLDEGYTVEDARSRMHLHLDELIARGERFRNEALVLMHFSQAYSPREVRRLLEARLPPTLRERVIPFAPAEGPWFG